jgi:hypothetical protein
MMRRAMLFIGALMAVAMVVFVPSTAPAQGGFTQVTGKAFDSALPREFYLEGNAIPTQKRNAAMLKTGGGARVLFALLDTSGYSSQVQEKYAGMIITEASLSVCGGNLGVGSYGFGLQKPAAPSNADAKFFVYDQAGKKVMDCGAKRDSGIHQPTPLQVRVGAGQPAKLYLGPYWIGLK